MHDVWVEKYRPRKLSDVIGQRNIVERLEGYRRTREKPHKVLPGAQGHGQLN